MLASGWITLGSHTHSHEDFRGRVEDFASDVAESVEQLQAKFGLENVAFAFPFGIVTDEMMDTVVRAFAISFVRTDLPGGIGDF